MLIQSIRSGQYSPEAVRRVQLIVLAALVALLLVVLLNPVFTPSAYERCVAGLEDMAGEDVPPSAQLDSACPHR